jgi:hypothetical protein
VVFVGIGVVIAAIFLLGRVSAASPLDQIGLRSAREIMDSREALEAEDLEQMLEAHNARRARRGQAAVSVDELEMKVMAEEGALARERDAVRREFGDPEEE